MWRQGWQFSCLYHITFRLLKAVSNYSGTRQIPGYSIWSYEPGHLRVHKQRVLSVGWYLNTLWMDTKSFFETSVCLNHLTRLSTLQDFIEHCRRENVKNLKEFLIYFLQNVCLTRILSFFFGKPLTSAMFIMRHISFYFGATDRGSCSFLLIVVLQVPNKLSRFW